MATLTSMPEYNWKDSNLALFGSDLDRKVKKESAETEPAWKSVLATHSSCLMVWRINKFKLEKVPPQDVGIFFTGDSYVVLNISKVGQELLYDVHFWIGKKSTQDEYGTAAYKCVELDTLLDDKAIQHREVDGFESAKFKSYFKNFKTVEGGYDSGFRHVETNEAKPRLYHFCGTYKTHVELREVPFTQKSLDSNDVFVLDLGKEIYQWNGSASCKDERFKASQFVQQLESERNGRCKVYVIDEGDADQNKLNQILPDTECSGKFKQELGKKAIYKLSDETGKMMTTLVCENSLPKSAIKSDDVFFIDTGASLYVYIGDGCSVEEKRNALSRAHEYLKSTNHPLAPITVCSGTRGREELRGVLD